MKSFKKIISKIALVFCMTLMVGILGSNNVSAQEVDLYTKLLMHMDDNTFKDECGHTITNNNVSLDTVNKVFGNSSACFNGTNYLIINNASELDLGVNDFTIDFRIKTNDLGGTCSFPAMISFGSYTAGNKYLNIKTDAYDGRITCWANGQSIAKSNTVITDNTFKHVAIVRKQNVFMIFINGILEKSVNYTDEFKVDKIMIGSDVHTGYFKGNIEELRISKGIARWTSNFNPPTSYYLSINEIKLNKTSIDLSVEQVDTLIATIKPENSTNKNVKWTSSNPEIATVDETGKVTAVKEGTATITATTQDGSNLSASCIVTVKPKGTTPTNPTDNNGNAILNITMTNGNIKSYTVSMTKVNNFISWYNNRSSGSNGSPYYMFDKTDNNQPFTKKSEYLVFDRISSFEVDEYNK